MPTSSVALCQASILTLLAFPPLLTPSLPHSIIVTACLATTTIFACFTAASLLTPRRTYMFLGGYLASAALSFLAMRLAGWIFGARHMVFHVEVYLGLLVFAAYVLFDTQVG